MTDRSKRILLAEDNTAQAKAIVLNLRAAGLHTKVVGNGLEAWMHARTTRFDLVITDYKMPDMMGSDLCRLLRDHAWYSSMPIILVTAHDRDLHSDRLKAELALSAVLRKPLNLEAFVDMIKQCLATDVCSTS